MMGYNLENLNNSPNCSMILYYEGDIGFVHLFYNHFYDFCIQNFFCPFLQFLDPETAVFLRFLDPETTPFLRFLDPEFFLSISTISGSRNCSIFAVSGYRNCTISTISGSRIFFCPFLQFLDPETGPP